MTTAQTLNEILADMLGFDTLLLQPDETLKSLGIDSLDHAELVLALEDHFLIEISDAQAKTLTTVGECIELIDKLTTK